MLNNFNQTFGQNTNNPFPEDSMSQSMNTMPPLPMAGNLTENQLYPFESQSNNPQVPTAFSKGGRVKRKKDKHNPYPSLAEMIRQQGNGEDTILAHINPLEAMMLKEMGGSGTINKKTGLPQFGLLNKPGKALKSIVGGGAGAILGNMILPGIGGVIGGALGQGAQHKSRGKSFTQGALKGGMMGASLPSLASLAGSGASSLGMNSAGNYLSQYGDANAILPSLGMGAASGATGVSGVSAGDSANHPSLFLKETGAANPLTEYITPTKAVKDVSFMDSLKNNSKSFLSKPKNLMALAAMGGSLMDKPKKEKTPEDLARDQKRYQKAIMLTPAERAATEADKLAERQMERRLARNQYLPEELFEQRPIYRKTSTPEEYKKTGKWITHYDNPNFSGTPLMMKKGGQVPGILVEERQITYPATKGMFLEGHTKGQDDKIPAVLSDGEYVIPADVVAHAGDGNSMAGGKQFDKFVRNIRRSKGGIAKLPPKAKSLTSYMR